MNEKAQKTRNNENKIKYAVVELEHGRDVESWPKPEQNAKQTNCNQHVFLLVVTLFWHRSIGRRRNLMGCDDDGFWLSKSKLVHAFVRFHWKSVSSTLIIFFSKLTGFLRVSPCFGHLPIKNPLPPISLYLQLDGGDGRRVFKRFADRCRTWKL